MGRQKHQRTGKGKRGWQKLSSDLCLGMLFISFLVDGHLLNWWLMVQCGARTLMLHLASVLHIAVWTWGNFSVPWL